MRNQTATLITLVLLMFSCGGKNTISKTGENDENIILFPSTMTDKETAISFALQNWNLKPRFLLTESISDLTTKENLERIRLNNLTIWNRLDKTEGKGSKKKYDAELIAELKRLEIAKQIFKKDNDVQLFLTNTYKTGEFVIPVPWAKSDNAEYIWRMWRILENGNDEKYGDGTFADFKIDLKKEEVEIIKYEK